MTWAQSLGANFTDGIVVLHRGRIVYERCFGALKEGGQHIAQSVTKSFFGTIGQILVAEGRLDENAPVSKYVPELKDSAFGDATIRQLLDMRTGLRYSEAYADPKAEVWAARARRRRAAAAAGLPGAADVLRVPAVGEEGRRARRRVRVQDGQQRCARLGDPARDGQVGRREPLAPNLSIERTFPFRALWAAASFLGIMP
jgi:hypothetical protein